LIFTGTYEHTIDQKQRLAIPAPLRATIRRVLGDAIGDDPKASGAVLYVVPTEVDALSLYTEPAFERLAAALDDSPLDAQELLDYERRLYSQTHQVEIDKQGRIRLPESLIQKAGLGSEIVLLGVKDRIEVRDKAVWLAKDGQGFEQNPGLWVNPRMKIR